MNIGMGTSPNLGSGVMAKFTRIGSSFSAQVVTPIAIFSCIGMRDAEKEQGLKEAMKAGKLCKMRSLRRDAHESNDTCIVHGSDMCLSSAELGS